MEDLFQYHIFVSVVHIEYGLNSNGNMLWHMKTQSHATPCQSSGNGKKRCACVIFTRPLCCLSHVFWVVYCVLCAVFSVSWSSKHRNRSLLAQFQPFKTDALAFIFTVVLSSYTQSIHATQNTKHSIVFHRCRILFFFSVSFFCGLQKRLDFFSLVRSVGFALLLVSCLSCYCLSCCIKHFSIRNFLHSFLSLLNGRNDRDDDDGNGVVQQWW